MRSRVLVSVLALAAMLATGFGTIRSLGQDAEHERITRRALEAYDLGPRTLDELAGKRGSFGAVGAPDRPGRGLSSVKTAHCDGGDWLDLPGYPHARAAAQATLDGCRIHIATHMKAAVKAAGALGRSGRVDRAASALDCPFDGKRGSAKCRVLEELGVALHASQDFYSHSNWVDPVGGPPSLTAPPGLNRSEPAEWLGVDSTAGFPAGLMSGCYEGFPETFYCGGRVRHATLNKDTAGAERGRGGVYAKAMDVATADTRGRWVWFAKAVKDTYGEARGETILCLVRRDDPAGCY